MTSKSTSLTLFNRWAAKKTDRFFSIIFHFSVHIILPFKNHIGFFVSLIQTVYKSTMTFLCSTCGNPQIHSENFFHARFVTKLKLVQRVFIVPSKYARHFSSNFVILVSKWIQEQLTWRHAEIKREKSVGCTECP